MRSIYVLVYILIFLVELDEHITCQVQILVPRCSSRDVNRREYIFLYMMLIDPM